MSNTDFMTEFKKLVFKKAEPDVDLLIPFFRWLSGHEENIEMCQFINKSFYKCDKSVLNKYMYLNNRLNKFIKVPKYYKADKELDFFYKDLAHYFGWTKRELFINMHLLDIDELKKIISTNYAYNNKDRKLLKVDKLVMK